jgi:hypothetical protein
MLLNRELEKRNFGPIYSWNFPSFIGLISLCIHFWFVTVILEYLKVVLLLVDILPTFTYVKLRKLLIFYHKAVLDSQTSKYFEDHLLSNV